MARISRMKIPADKDYLDRPADRGPRVSHPFLSLLFSTR